MLDGSLARTLITRELFFEVVCDFVNRGVLTQLSDFGIVGDACESKLAGHFALHAEGSGDFFFSEQQDLQNQVISLVGTTAEALLAHHDKAREEDGFHGDDGIEERAWKWIEMPNAPDSGCIEHQPGSEPGSVHQHECQTSDRCTNPVSDTLGKGSLFKELLFMPGY